MSKYLQEHGKNMTIIIQKFEMPRFVICENYRFKVFFYYILYLKLVKTTITIYTKLYYYLNNNFEERNNDPRPLFR